MIESAFVSLPRKRAWVGEREKWIPRCEFLNLTVLWFKVVESLLTELNSHCNCILKTLWTEAV